MLNALLLNDVEWIVYISVITACVVLIFIAALLAILFILFQKSNSEGIQGITASSETFFGKHKGRSIEAKLKKWSWILLAVVGVLSIVVYVVQIILKA